MTTILAGMRFDGPKSLGAKEALNIYYTKSEGASSKNNHHCLYIDPSSSTPCGRSFDRANDACRHYRGVHAKELSWSCTFPGCHLRTAQKSAMETHMRVHLRISEHPCRVCGKKFTDSSARSRHEHKVCKVSRDKAERRNAPGRIRARRAADAGLADAAGASLATSISAPTTTTTTTASAAVSVPTETFTYTADSFIPDGYAPAMASWSSSSSSSSSSWSSSSSSSSSSLFSPPLDTPYDYNSPGILDLTEDQIAAATSPSYLDGPCHSSTANLPWYSEQELNDMLSAVLNQPMGVDAMDIGCSSAEGQVLGTVEAWDGSFIDPTLMGV